MGAPQLKDHRAPQGAEHEAEGHDNPFASHKKVEEGEGPWLVSYADLMTLLMGFFALMFSMSQLNQEKVEKVKASTSESFGGEYQPPYQGLSDSIVKFLEENKLQDQVQIKVDAKGVELTFTGTLFFDSGEIVVKPGAADLLARLAEKIKAEPTGYKALIEGHTDAVPIAHSIIASNWELSGLRAARIAQLFEGAGFSRSQLTIIGWGDSKPIAPEVNETGEPIPENRAKNRRVVIRIYDHKLSGDPVSR